MKLNDIPAYQRSHGPSTHNCTEKISSSVDHPCIRLPRTFRQHTIVGSAGIGGRDLKACGLGCTSSNLDPTDLTQLRDDNDKAILHQPAPEVLSIHTVLEQVADEYTSVQEPNQFASCASSSIIIINPSIGYTYRKCSSRTSYSQFPHNAADGAGMRCY